MPRRQQACQAAIALDDFRELGEIDLELNHAKK
jgi:hypothetical protein